ncbi:MAG: hypothetical protein KAG53_05880 [Endozoicomonadaceae bacterium]|nr:hypothetical protein [Endozoicomonadaceae bacterium]
MKSLNILRSSNKNNFPSLKTFKHVNNSEDLIVTPTDSKRTSDRNLISAFKRFVFWIIKQILSCCCMCVNHSEDKNLIKKTEVSKHNIDRYELNGHPIENSNRAILGNCIVNERQRFKTRQRGPTCKIATLAFCHELFYGHDEHSYIPLFKQHEYRTSVRSIAKTCGSVQGEVVDLIMLNNIANKLNLELSIKQFKTEKVFNDEIKKSIDKNCLIMIFIQMRNETAVLNIPANSQSLEHAVVIYGYNTEEKKMWGYNYGESVCWDSNVLYNAAINVNKKRKAETFYKHVSKNDYCTDCKWHDQSYIPPSARDLKVKNILKFRTSKDPCGSFFGVMCQIKKKQ